MDASEFSSMRTSMTSEENAAFDTPCNRQGPAQQLLCPEGMPLFRIKSKISIAEQCEGDLRPTLQMMTSILPRSSTMGGTRLKISDSSSSSDRFRAIEQESIKEDESEEDRKPKFQPQTSLGLKSNNIFKRRGTVFVPYQASD